MSHFTHIKTRFQNLFYLKKGLAKLGIAYSTCSENLTIPQSDSYNIEFAWNGHEYELVADMSFWDQPYPMETFIDKVSQQYAAELIIGESKKIGFQPIQYGRNADGTDTVILQRF